MASKENKEEDEALAKYKAQLLKGMENPFPDDPRKVIAKKFFCNINGKLEEFDLEDSKSEMTIKLKEGSQFKFGIGFYTNHEISNGLKMKLTVKGKLVGAYSEDYLMGSFLPKKEMHQWVEKDFSEAPSGMTKRGTYTGNGSLYDREGKKYCDWTFKFTITK
eukprot:jgi/Bigna1/89347/estExt_fgenesh1_pg.C_470119